MELIQEFIYRVYLKEPLQIGTGPYGARIYYEIASGEIKGERLAGKLVSGGGDWMISGNDGWWRPDVRAQIQTDDGALLGLSYDGLVEVNQKFQQAVDAAAGTNYEDHYFRIRPKLETGDSRYSWVNHTLFVGKGHIVGPFALEYTVYQVS